MQVSRFLVGSVLLTGCATAGVFPKGGDPYTAGSNAENAIAEAQRAGADSLATAELAAARAALDLSRAIIRKDPDRAELRAREAAADALYAKAMARKAAADRAQREAQAALAALNPPGGAQ